MKTIILAILLLASIPSKAQLCYLGSCEKPSVTAAVIIDNSFKYYQPNGFSGFGIHAGVWIGWLRVQGLGWWFLGFGSRVLGVVFRV